MDIERIKEKVLEEHRPEEEALEETREKYREIAEFIETEFSLQTHFAGSSSRGTCMKGDRDIDIFVLFPRDIDRTELENRGLEVGKAVFDEFNGEYEIEYAEHPYTKGDINGHEVEIVPCHDVDPTDIKSAVDRTPHHSRWVDENLSGEQRKDVVAFKVFLRSAGLYGSSLKIRGFSGYLCEVLTSHYGSFDELVENASPWGEREVIDPENHHDGELPEELEDKFEDDNLVVIDPIDPERNVASVLSTENYSKFIYRCWEFLQNPGINFFEEEEREYTEFEIKQELEKRGDTLVITFETPEDVDDVLYPQMRKTVSRIESELGKRDFRIFESGFHIGEEETRILLELERELPETMDQKGPKVFHGHDHLEQFTSKYVEVYIKGDRLCARTEREYTDAKDFLKDFLLDDLKAKGIPGNIAEKITDFSFVDPLEGEPEWLKYLAEKLHIGE